MMNMTKWILTLSLAFILLLLLIIGYFYLKVSQYDDTPTQSSHADAGVVLGAALWNGKPSPALVERLEVAAKLYRDKKVEYVIVSGGLEEEGVTEALAMKEYLVQKKVPQDRILLEDQSSNTQQNLENTMKLLTNTQIDNIVIITHDYHMTRALQYAKQTGLKDSLIAPVHSKVLFMPYHKARESLALIKQSLGF
ncbi:protein SanA, affects membrane permeability for vancomycin [Thermoactinomyces sp. DSM 45891]|uniref:YdcF family protein n=1 Tax=Thermoactinomyces sp. DSM 45891 TaxID=1761907 RepID=UPI000920BFE3|nr:YdcF family protein [Thermoactinomyces sp. DSM 45891]SFX17963.1 protein SanA, affects membrane permeability for vancomycin [Thermoactinomyces sp. DSM 45891]